MVTKRKTPFDTGFLQACIDRMSKSQSKIESNLSSNPLELQNQNKYWNRNPEKS